MKIIKILICIMGTISVCHSQTSLHVFAGADVLSYKWDTTSDPYISAGINVMGISDNGWIKEATVAYSRQNETDNIYAGIYLGKSIGLLKLRSGVRTIGLLDTKSNTNFYLCAMAGYSLHKSVMINLDYSWSMTNTTLHTLGVNAMITLYRE